MTRTHEKGPDGEEDGDSRRMGDGNSAKHVVVGILSEAQAAPSRSADRLALPVL